ncbi:MAG: hypothetical protein ACE5EY_06330 [Anaerolineae bacterium]
MEFGLINTAFNNQQPINLPSSNSDLAVLREKLKKLGVWPEAGDKFLELLPMSRWNSAPITDADTSWVPIVIDGVLNGFDIGARFPSFFQKLLMSDVLREAFLSALSERMKS